MSIRAIITTYARRGPALLLGLGLFMATTTAAADLADTVAKIKPSIVAVGVLEPAGRPPARFHATGFVVGQGLHVVTNAHALPDYLNPQNRETLSIFIGRNSKLESRPAQRVALDPIHDLALLSFEGPPLPALTLGPSRHPREGQEIAFTGFPLGVVLGLFPVTHSGIIAAISPIAIPVPAAGQLDAITLKRLQNEPYDVLQLNATAYPGNSGSPLYEPQTGRVIGVINKVFVQESKETLLEKPSGITYAIPVEHVQALLRQVNPTAQ